MSEFVVSARKYRPKEWADVVGQKSITDTLNNAIQSNQLANAYLFCGPRGVGKTTCARIFAREINQGTNPDPDQDFAFNIFELDAASNNSVDDIRSLTDQVRIPPQQGKYKVYIIDEVHMLSTQAFNAFLKTLEEPPPHALFVLATTEKHKILPTILSRCQIYDFSRIGVKDIAAHLQRIAEKENVSFDANGLLAIARKADGALRDALSIFDQVVSFSGGDVSYKSVSENLSILGHETFFKVTEAILNEDIPQAVLTYHDVITRGFDSHQFILGMAEHFRNLILAGNEETKKLIEVGEDTLARYVEQLGQVDAQLIMAGLTLLGKTEGSYRQAQNKKLHVELALMQLCSIRSHEKKKPWWLIDELPESISIMAPVGIPAAPKVDLTSIGAAPTENGNGHDATPPPPAKPEEAPAVTAAPVSAPPKPAPAKVAAKAFSISQALSPNKPAEDTAVADEPGITRTDLPREPFSPDDVLKVWTRYANKVKAQGKVSFHSTLTSRKPEVQGSVIKLLLSNTVQKEDLHEHKMEMLEYIRTELKNFDIQLTWEVTQTETEANLYTPMQKFNKMAESNPKLHDLRKRFDLDIDF